MVYQLVLQEKLAEVSLLLAQNQEQQVGQGPARAPRQASRDRGGSPTGPSCPQEEVMWDLAGSKGPRVKDSKSLPLNLYVGHFLKPYFKDKVTGVVSPRRRVHGAGAPPPPTVSSHGLQGGGLRRPSPPTPGSRGESRGPLLCGAGQLLHGSAQGLASRGGRGPARQGCPVLVVGPGFAGGSFPLVATLCRWGGAR